MGKTLQPGVPWLNSRLEACNGPEAENSQKKVSQWFPGVNKKLGLEAEIKRKANVCYGFEQAEALWIRSTKWKRQSCTGRRVEVIWRDFLNTEVVEWFQLTLINWWLTPAVILEQEAKELEGSLTFKQKQWNKILGSRKLTMGEKEG